MTTVALSLLALILCCEHEVSGETPSPVVTIQSAPESPIVELRDANQFLNFDLIVHIEQADVAPFRNPSVCLRLSPLVGDDEMAEYRRICAQHCDHRQADDGTRRAPRRVQSVLPLRLECAVVRASVLILPASRGERAGTRTKPASLA
jgi:hypothetical protein